MAPKAKAAAAAAAAAAEDPALAEHQRLQDAAFDLGVSAGRWWASSSSERTSASFLLLQLQQQPPLGTLLLLLSAGAVAHTPAVHSAAAAHQRWVHLCTRNSLPVCERP